jgi:hypothetical protein
MRLALLLLLLSSSIAFARSEKTFAYPRDQAWGTAVRFLRVDEELKIVEKDPEAGYVLFELRDDGKTWKGSMEVIGQVVDGRPVVKVVVTIEDRPSYLESGMLTRLERKLRVELGTPAPAPTPKKPPEKAPDNSPPPADKPKDDGGPPVSPTP